MKFGFTKKSNKGFTLIELMISLFVGAFILAGVMFTYLGMKVTTSETMDLGELQESGRLAMDVLKRDIELSGFWGNYSLTPDADTLLGGLPAAPANDCSAGQNNASFPVVSNRKFISLFASDDAMNCIGTANGDSDILQVKRVVGQDSTGQPTSANQQYFIANPQAARIVNGTGGVIPTTGNEKVWEYLHNVYFIQDQNYTLNGKTVSIPTLRRMRLTRGRMTAETIMEGVESLRFLFGLDTNGDARVDIYRSVDNMNQADWEQGTSSILTVQIFLLVRTFEPNPSNSPGEQTFVLGGDTPATLRTLTFNDDFRRKLLTSTVRLMNSGSDKWVI
ncbi:PilW family protein [Pseudoalteromonas sp. MMG024]|uniref:PilW family protein n=1 Tax=Pseudoalteromonas sp. MMG024 TaxID=2909980 RepID=UPI001EFFED0F|nr:PilW family protein [Pseudoalteromonas sp. MMG024]MCF6457111.1 PilW family protein [Pseudoalteromonas sp. MMG024]